MTPEAHAAFTRTLVATLADDPDVLGVVLLGSTSGAPPLPDAFSDHDFFVVTRPGVQERFRNELGWLPEAAAIALAFRETSHGVKVLYASGHLAEFAAFDLDELSVARVNRYRVAFDRADVAARMQRVRETSVAGIAPLDVRWRIGQFLTQLVVGAYRDARGERLSGHHLVRVHALGNLLDLLRARVPRDVAARLDDLDPSRRFELALPELGRELDAALRTPVVVAARALLDIAVRELADLIPAAARGAVEHALAAAAAASTT